MSERGPWLLTATGRRFFLLDPQPSEVHVADVAHALAHTCRFGGHTRWHYSVAQHSVLVADMVIDAGRPDLELVALLHDATEAYVGDCIRPLKRELARYQVIEAGVWVAIAARFGLAVELPVEVKHADNVALATERRDVMMHEGHSWDIDEAKYQPSERSVERLEPAAARMKFLTRLRALLPAEYPSEQP